MGLGLLTLNSTKSIIIIIVDFAEFSWAPRNGARAPNFLF